jgi:hypothetical protein
MTEKDEMDIFEVIEAVKRSLREYIEKDEEEGRF